MRSHKKRACVNVLRNGLRKCVKCKSNEKAELRVIPRVAWAAEVLPAKVSVSRSCSLRREGFSVHREMHEKNGTD
jgi:hypothetical protein